MLIMIRRCVIRFSFSRREVTTHNKDYFIGLNHLAHINRQNQEVEAASTVTVHSVRTPGGKSDLEAKLSMGEIFEIPGFGGRILVDQIDMSANPPIAKVDVNDTKCASDVNCNDRSTCATNTCKGILPT